MRTPSRLLAFATLLTFAGAAHAVEDGPPIDIRGALQMLQQLKEQQSKQTQSVRQRAFQEAQAAAADPTRAAALWEDAVRATQFQGVSKEGQAWRDWKEKEGAGLREKEVLSALRLHFNWLALTLRHSDGVPTKDLIPAIAAHVKEVIADQAAMDAFDEAVKRERDAGNQPNKGRANPREAEKRLNDASVKRLHDQIAKQPLTASPYVEWVQISEIIKDVAPAQAGRGRGQRAEPAPLPGAPKREASGSPWVILPGDVDAIYTTLIQPALREANDPRIVEYWDYRLRREGELAVRTKLQFEIDKFNQVRRPQLLWNRMRDLAAIGLKNRAAADMLALIKGNTTHPDLTGWINELETLLAPPDSAAAPAPPPGSAARP